jgi:hypothetical protein
VTRLLALIALCGALGVAAGVFWIYPPAGLIVAGLFALAAGLLTEVPE